MQLIPRYLYKNQVDVVSNDTGFVVEYRPVYSRNIKIYKGVDNKIQFRMLNADQKPVNINGDVIEFEAWDDENDQALLLTATNEDDGTKAKRGKFYVTILENDLLDIPSQYLTYTVYQKETPDSRAVTYSNSHFGAAGVLELDHSTHPTIKKSVEIKNWLKTSNTKYHAGSDSTDKITANPKQNKNSALHSVAIYTDAVNNSGFVGTVKIQGTLDNQIGTSNNWYDIDTITFAGTETKPVFNHFNGVYTYLRFEASADPADKITKILVRN